MLNARTFARNAASSLLAAVVMAASLIVIAAPADALTFTVTTSADTVSATDGVISLREAVTRANTFAGNHRIVLAAATTYQLTRCGVGEEDLNRSGDLDYRGNSTLTIAAKGSTIQQTCVDGGGTPDRGGIETTNAAATLVANDLTITGAGLSAITAAGNLELDNATIYDNLGAFAGGAYVQGSATITDSTFSGNEAVIAGGGLTADFATITDSTFSGNTGGGYGGAMAVGELTLTSSTIDGNTARLLGSSSSGGGIYLGTGTITDTTLTGNTAEVSGGGIHAADEITISGSTIDTNSSDDDGAGLYAETDATVADSTLSNNVATDIGGGAYVLGTLDVDSTVVTGNTASAGGGLAAEGTLAVDSSTVNDNTASFIAAALASGSSDVVTLSSTISGNATAGIGPSVVAFNSLQLYSSTVSDNTGGAIAYVSAQAVNSTVSGNTNLGLAGPSIVTAFSTVTGNDVGVWQTDPSGTFLSLPSVMADNGADCLVSGIGFSSGYNYDTDASCGFTDSADTSGGSSPLLGTLADNGGGTETHLPDPSSPLVDAVPATFEFLGIPLCPGTVSTLATDQRGITRPQGSGCDIGAVELE
ncbi:MAG: hypothetical protein JJLCMIEE_03514 [Acidimicrobiales bacterium]|nr:MAG: right-handed parallel beta-helix repeat-containing protein [Actinomycetota bacterium]MBV6510374.1 hypothetical protein [Acidimicrobiales bacterium]RIK03211.1 MAG: hypothetical protein DCC48_17005 [Acidobacteriota bacterium]